MYQIRHSKLPVRLISQDPLTPEYLDTLALNMTYPSSDGYSPWELWVDEYGEFFSAYKKDPNQLELFPPTMAEAAEYKGGHLG